MKLLLIESFFVVILVNRVHGVGYGGFGYRYLCQEIPKMAPYKKTSKRSVVATKALKQYRHVDSVLHDCMGLSL